MPSPGGEAKVDTGLLFIAARGPGVTIRHRMDQLLRNMGF